jgi:hypothetical protein
MPLVVGREQLQGDGAAVIPTRITRDGQRGTLFRYAPEEKDDEYSDDLRAKRRRDHVSSDCPAMWCSV